MSARRILHVTPYFRHAWAYGGIPRVVAALADGLARRGDAVTVCTTDAADRRRRLDRSSHVDRSADVRVFPNVSNRAAYALQLFAPIGLGRYLRAHAGDFDIAHLHACRNLPGIIAARELRRAGVPYVVTPNGTAPRIERRRAAKWVVDRTIGRGYLAGAARVLAVSAAERDDLCRLDVSVDRLRIVGNPLALDEFDRPRNPDAFRQRIGIAAPFVLYLGQITPRKRIDVLIRAFAAVQTPALALVIAGEPTTHTRRLRRLAATLGIAAHVHFVGLVAGHARLEAIAAASVVAYPSEREVFGLVALESILCNTPVIVSDDSGCAEIIRETGGGHTVAAGDAAALASAIRAAIAPGARTTFGLEAAAARVRARFSTDAIAAELCRAYDDVTAERQA